MSAVFPEPDESIERALFERRARANRPLDAAGLPSLDAVLRAARAPDAAASHEPSTARRRAWGLALAAACFLTVMKARPTDVAGPAIVSDVRAEAPIAPVAAGASGGTCDELEVAACESETSCSLTPVAEAPAPQDDGLCASPSSTFASSAPRATLACAPDDALLSDVH